MRGSPAATFSVTTPLSTALLSSASSGANRYFFFPSSRGPTYHSGASAEHDPVSQLCSFTVSALAPPEPTPRLRRTVRAVYTSSGGPPRRSSSLPLSRSASCACAPPPPPHTFVGLAPPPPLPALSKKKGAERHDIRPIGCAAARTRPNRRPTLLIHRDGRVPGRRAEKERARTFEQGTPLPLSCLSVRRERHRDGRSEAWTPALTAETSHLDLAGSRLPARSYSRYKQPRGAEARKHSPRPPAR